MRIEWLLGAFLALLLGACSDQNANVPQPTFSTSASGAVSERLAFFDSDAFDASLANALASNPHELQLTFPGNTQLNQMPPRVNAWLTQVQKNNGTVVAKDPANPSRGFLGLGMIADVIDLISWYRERSQRQTQLATADNYNATLLYDSKSGVLKDIVFSRK
jgi:hypothetical protein